MKRVFIDGSAGTTGLVIAERLAKREELSLLTLPEETRKDPVARQQALEEADVAFLCLPDDAAKEAALLAPEKTVLIDTSTAHRTAPGWVYGFPEIGGRREQICTAKRIANPGCHASGVIALLAPLREGGLLAADAKITAVSLTGYTGGGKAMIAQYEGEMEEHMAQLFSAPRLYGLSQEHKHLPEITAVCELQEAPVFCPIVAPYPRGMEVMIPLFADVVRGGKAAIEARYAETYATGLVRFVPEDAEEGFLSAAAFAGRDDMVVTVQGNDERIVLIARFDNLGKGASGAAIQNMNLVLGLPEKTGLVVPQ